MSQQNKIRVHLGEGLSLVAELYDHDGGYPEIAILVEKDGCVHQDICAVRPDEW